MGDEAPVVKIDKDLEDLIPGYLQRRLADVSLIRDAIGNNDLETIRILGHTMKGGGGGYGFGLITEIGRRIEEAAKAGNKDEILACAKELDQFLATVHIEYE